MSESRRELTLLLSRIRSGDEGAREELAPLVYGELKNLARIAFARQSSGHTLQPTALVHEAWMKLSPGLERIEDRRHFLAVASRAMRQVLADHARALKARKRSSRRKAVTFHEGLRVSESSGGIDVVDLNDALGRLAVLNDRHARVVELRLLGALTVEEIAETLGVSVSTVKADWTMARLWLRRELAG